MSPNGTQKRREVSPVTLAIAAVASAAAAITTSYFWKGGTIMTAALTPVIVALVKEALQRPIDSGVVTRPVQRMAEARTRAPVREPEHVYSGAPSRFEEPPVQHRPPSTRRFGGEPAPQMSPVRTYGRQTRLRRWHLKAAVVTGLIAFVIALLVLTVPELVFGGSVSGHGSTTFFSHSSKKSSSTNNQQQKTDTTQTDTNQTTTPPAQNQQGTQTSTQPQQQQQTAPSQTPPGGTPAPQQSPAPSTPPAQPSP